MAVFSPSACLTDGRTVWPFYSKVERRLHSPGGGGIPHAIARVGGGIGRRDGGDIGRRVHLDVAGAVLEAPKARAAAHPAGTTPKQPSETSERNSLGMIDHIIVLLHDKALEVFQTILKNDVARPSKKQLKLWGELVDVELLIVTQAIDDSPGSAKGWKRG